MYPIHTSKIKQSELFVNGLLTKKLTLLKSIKVDCVLFTNLPFSRDHGHLVIMRQHVLHTAIDMFFHPLMGQL